ncbi:MAG: isoprenyl transferase [Saprospiraceae bacterium]|nr:isoprenyl transferase [Saprospiraceae bacterium]
MSESIRTQIDQQKLPKHVAIIMDGNGRWAKREGKPRLMGHREGVNSVKAIAEACAELGIPYLTLYAFSTENWNRPLLEVTGLMDLLVETLRHELESLSRNGIRLQAIGDLGRLPSKTRDVLMEAVDATRNNKRLTLVLALNYSARWEILHAVNQLGSQIRDRELNLPISEEQFTGALSTAGIPDPELLIRTSGEHRISNFLLWQLAYTELYFSELYWPEFRKTQLLEALSNYQQRERRFGKTSEQL